MLLNLYFLTQQAAKTTVQLDLQFRKKATKTSGEMK